MKLFGSKPDTHSTQKRTGKFIVIDGPDGSGKNTQTQLLAETLGDNNYNGIIFSFPQYTQASAAMIEKYLAGNYGTNLNPKASSIFFAIDRFDASYKINDHLAQGHIVLADRYVISNAGHQGANIEDRDERIAFYKWLDDLEYNIFNVPRPDLNIILHIPFEISRQLIEKRNREEGRATDIYEQDLDHLKRAEEIYLETAQLIPNTKIVECVENGELLSRQRIHAKVWELVRRMVLKNH